METSPKQLLSEKEVLDLCRTEVEAMHDVHFLMSRPNVSHDDLQLCLAHMNGSLQKLTDILCRE
ncbi:hypothetical protein Terro_2997 [Terriglobus roseus DSM 18391]|uniref:Uncharacterized protein n=1 Tax=Terriglobus roseus (strain DSM 18391 / NRRL B-41598 / KBS 63) TaxID=926566 RepID=I3ZJ11_TERRK|nr:hypothetical protein Terro_2997 [Terriglobus roseus DSM 18391]